MQKKTKAKIKKEKKQFVEIHIYIHQDYTGNWTTPIYPYNPNTNPGIGNPITNPPYIVTC